MDISVIDKTGLIGESYQMAGIAAPECRSIFLDWALKLPAEVDQQAAISHLIGVYTKDNPDHPMSVVLREGQGSMARKGRRGGRAARIEG